jgi:transcription elongation GreA/GreB family factor
MSRAFVKEPNGGDVYEDLPDRPVSEHPNLVTEEGLAQIEAELTRLHHQHAAAQAENNRAALARIGRDLRYWTARRSTAELIPPPADMNTVRFGCTVTIEREDGRRQAYRIVGEDEADPAQGRLAYVSPLARVLIGKNVGDFASVGENEVEIVAIS